MGEVKAEDLEMGRVSGFIRVGHDLMTRVLKSGDSSSRTWSDRAGRQGRFGAPFPVLKCGAKYAQGPERGF